MTSIPRFMVFLLIAVALLNGQSFRVPPSSSDAKTPGQFSIILDSPPGKAPAALQWELSVPPAVAIDKGDIKVGKAAKAAGKSITCAAKPGRLAVPGGARYACVLAGGKDIIGQGQVATVGYREQADVGGAPIRVAIENILGVSQDLKRIDIPNVDAILTFK
jgi:hypothetical protein